MPTNPNLTNARAASQADFRNEHVRLGFELETMNVNNLNWSDLHRQNVSVQRTRNVIAETPENYRNRLYFEDLSATRQKTERKILKKICAILRVLVAGVPQDNQIKIPVSDTFKHLGYFVTSYPRRGHNGFCYLYSIDDNQSLAVRHILRSTIAQLTDSPNKRKLIRLAADYLAVTNNLLPDYVCVPNPETRTETYTEDQRLSLKDYLRSICFSDTSLSLDWKQDGSVSGPEITTVGPQIFGNIVEHINSLFDDLERVSFEVNTGCSFHIHASINGVTPKYSANFQSFLMRFLLNDQRVPASVRERWKSNSLDQYFNFSLDSNKYRFVAYRNNTWEFRCFGNISNKLDAIACMTIVSDAYHAAINNTETLMLPIGMSFTHICSHAARTGKTFDESLAYLTQRDQSDAA